MCRKKDPLQQERDWADRDPDADQPEYEPTYRDGSLKNECWNSEDH